MKKRGAGILVLIFILAGYSFLFMATKPNFPCEDDCEKVQQVSEAVRLNRESYVLGAARCAGRFDSDSLCIYVKDTTGINWGLFADSCCSIATQYGLLQQTIFILKNVQYPPDTLAIRNCP